jgi:hypothetical protein
MRCATRSTTRRARCALAVDQLHSIAATSRREAVSKVALRQVRKWHECDLPPRPGYVGFRMNYGRDLLAVSRCDFDPQSKGLCASRAPILTRLRDHVRHIGPRPMPQQREVTHRFMIARFRSAATSIAIIPRRSATLMAARAFALPTLARSAIRATGRVHFPVAMASFRMTASTAIASVFRCSPIEGGTTTVAARNRRPHTTRCRVSALLLFFAIRVSINSRSKRGGSSFLGSIQIALSQPPNGSISRYLFRHAL